MDDLFFSRSPCLSRLPTGPERKDSSIEGRNVEQAGKTKVWVRERCLCVWEGNVWEGEGNVCFRIKGPNNKYNPKKPLLSQECCGESTVSACMLKPGSSSVPLAPLWGSPALFVKFCFLKGVQGSALLFSSLSNVWVGGDFVWLTVDELYSVTTLHFNPICVCGFVSHSLYYAETQI
jgi:hypothetical protein